MATCLRASVLAVIAFGLATPVQANEPFLLDRIDTECLETILSDCKVLTAGFVNMDWGDREGAPMLAWQTQTGFTPDDGVLGGFVLLQHEAGTWTRLDSGFDGSRFYPPRLSEEGLLHIPGYTGGTGAYNADRLYQWDETGWRPVDMTTWSKSIAERLPDGLEIWKGVQYEFENPWSGLVARTPLWRGDDANCCPTGGNAEIAFAVDDSRLVVTDLRYTPPKN